MATAFEEPQSPRDVIRNWLSRTTDRGDQFPMASKHPEPNVKEDRYRNDHHPSRRHLENRNAPQQKSEYGPGQEGRLETNVMWRDSGYRRRAMSVDKPGQSLAERLGLQPPFRLLGGGTHHREDLENNERHRKKKRRISASSGSTYLQPAIAAANTEAENDNHNRSRRRHPRDRVGDVLDADFASSINSSSCFSATDGSLKKPAETYERRPRHKTREDRYETKQDKKLQKAKAKEAAKKDGKRKRKEKSGAALASSFRAKNVAQDRLTLRPVAKVGLFKKGRASSPVRRRGLPDLAFSEMTFLNTRRERDGGSDEVANGNKRRKKGKAADVEEEISRFFTSARAPIADSGAETGHNRSLEKRALRDLRRRRTEHGRRVSSVNSSALPESISAADLPGRPFLGFGNRGARRLSPAIVYETTSDNAHAKSPPRDQSISTVSARSHLTWSRSGSASHGSTMDGITRVERDPSEKGHNGKSAETSSNVGQLNLIGGTACPGHLQAECVYTPKSPMQNRLGNDAAKPDAGPGDGRSPPGLDQNPKQGTKATEPQGHDDKEQAEASVANNEAPTKVSAAGESGRDRAVLRHSILSAGQSMATEETPPEYLDSGIDRLLRECKTKAAEVAPRQEERNQTARAEHQETQSPLQNRQDKANSVNSIEPHEPRETDHQHLQQSHFDKDATPDQIHGVTTTPGHTIISGPGSATYQNACDGVYGCDISTNTIEGYFAVPEGIQTSDRHAWQGATRSYRPQIRGGGAPACGRYNISIRGSSMGISSGSWPLAYDYNLAGPSFDRMAYQNLYATQDNDHDGKSTSSYIGKEHGRPIDNHRTPHFYHLNRGELEYDAEPWETQYDGATVTLGPRPLEECGFAEVYDQLEVGDALPTAIHSINASDPEQVELPRGYDAYEFIGSESSAVGSLPLFPRFNALGNFVSEGTADERRGDTPPIPDFWRPHKLY